MNLTTSVEVNLPENIQTCDFLVLLLTVVKFLNFTLIPESFLKFRTRVEVNCPENIQTCDFLTGLLWNTFPKRYVNNPNSDSVRFGGGTWFGFNPKF